MFTVTVVWAVPTGTVEVGGGVVVVVGAVVVVGVGVGLGAATPTANFPFMPAFAWPVSVHRYCTRPFFENLTVSLADWPGPSIFVTLPAMKKLWVIFPLFTTLKVTVVPTGTDFLDTVKENSFAETGVSVG